MNLRVTNTALLILLAGLSFTGVYGIVWPMPGWLYDAHRLAAFELIGILPWKLGIAWRSLARGIGPGMGRGVGLALSLFVATATLVILALGLIWAANIVPDWRILDDTAISWHWMIALGLTPFLGLHVLRRWPKPRARELLGRRAALRYLGWGVAGLAGWTAMSWVARARETPIAPRALSGSREQGSFSGNGFPITNGPGEGRAPLDRTTWTFLLWGAVQKPLRLSYGDLLARSAREITATIDCTTGWYCTQVWRGVPLALLLEEAGAIAGAGAVRLIASSGYVAEYPLDEAKTLVLATHVGGEVLDHWHGFPLRAVAPTRRGWHWVKWLTAVEVRAGPHAVAPFRLGQATIAARGTSAERGSGAPYGLGRHV